MYERRSSRSHNALARRARTMRLLVALAQCACSSRSHNALACRAPNPPPRTAVHDCRNVQGAHGGLKHGLPRSPTQPRPPRPHPRRLGDRRLDIAASATGGSTSPPRRPVARHRRLGATPSPQKRLCTTAAMCKAQTVGSSTACPARPHSPAPLARTLDGSATGGLTSPPRRPVARHRRLGDRWLDIAASALPLPLSGGCNPYPSSSASSTPPPPLRKWGMAAPS